MKTCGLLLLILAFLALLFGANGCGDGGDGNTDTEKPPEPTKLRTITIGNLSDLTGPSATAQAVINMSLADLVKHFNEDGLIPGARLAVVTYDGQFDPAKDVAGYEWLRGQGADLIFTAVTGTPVTLKPRADRDKFAVFGVSGGVEELSPPGYVFNLGTIPRHEALSLLKWIAENDWDYKTKGPAKIGLASWNEAYANWWMEAMEDYAKAHPDQFEWVGGYLTPFGTFTWGPQVDKLKNTHYVFPCTIMTSFVREFRQAGGEAKLIGASTHAAFFGNISDARLWDQINGMLLICSSRWWNEEGTVIDLTKELLYENHPDQAEEIIRLGVGYITTVNLYELLELIAQTVKAVGAENFSSETLYETAQSYTLTIDGAPRYSFSPTKRWATNLYATYEARAAEETIVRLHEDWHPAVTEP
ncbi:MAG: ABC transporter substrate-binding protein [Chloroflexi bacterium]|nr:ABC transporter substrate-binding protein [Chloroflexota bacterium]